jgi:hypothetical protein
MQLEATLFPPLEAGTRPAVGRNGHIGPRGRDSGGFVTLPWTVLDCAAYARLSHPARALLVELARQYVRDNNGWLLLSYAYMRKRGWNSADALTCAKRELLDGGFIHETVKGDTPNKAGCYAVTWHPIDRIPGYDPGGLESFERSAYLHRGGNQNAELRRQAALEGLLLHRLTV